MSTLAEIQHRFKQAVCEENGKLAKEVLGIRDSETFPWKKRLHVYQYAYRARIEESLQEDFSETEKKVGSQVFSVWLKHYLQTYPSKFASLAEVSRDFPRFILQNSGHPKAPAFSELARYEWLQIEVSLEEENRSNNLSQLAQIDPSEFDGLSFTLHASTKFFESNFTVHGKLIEKPTSLLLYRKDEEVYVRSITKKEKKLLDAISKGVTLRDIGVLKQELRISEALASRWFSEWVQEGIVHSFQKGS